MKQVRVVDGIVYSVGVYGTQWTPVLFLLPEKAAETVGVVTEKDESIPRFIEGGYWEESY